MDKTVYIGIDIACKKFDAAVFSDKKKMRHRIFDNSIEGFKAFLTWIGEPAFACHIAMEATNCYWEELAYFLNEAGCSVSVVNLKCIKAYATGLNIRNKTDRIDAGVIARYVAKEQPRLWTPPPMRYRELLLLQRQAEHLKCCLSKEQVRLTMACHSGVKQSIQRHIEDLKQEIVLMEKAIAALIKNVPTLKENAALLSSIPGVGCKTLPWLLAYLWDGQRFKSAKAAATYASLTPMFRESGTSLSAKPHISKIGHSEIRKALYMPALVYSRTPEKRLQHIKTRYCSCFYFLVTL